MQMNKNDRYKGAAFLILLAAFCFPALLSAQQNGVINKKKHIVTEQREAELRKKEDEQRKILDRYLDEFRKNKLIPGISAGVALNGEIFWLGNSGVADVENGSPVTDSTLFRIASISKSITAVAIMQLVEKGKIKLDNDARTYIPSFPKKKWKFTVRQLLSHTAGIRNYYRGEFDDTKHYPAIRDAVNIVSGDTLAYKPGTKYLYTTFGYNLLGLIIENASGQSYADYLRKNIFEPALMNSTIPDYQQRIIYHRAGMYQRNRYRILENAPLADLSNKYPGGGLLSTSGDLLRFTVSLLEGKLVRPETLDSMLVPTRLKNGTLVNYGLGFTLGKDYAGRKYFAHDGYDGTSLLLVYPVEKLAAVDLLNIRDRNNGSAAFDLASTVLDDTVIYPAALLSDRLMLAYRSGGIDSVLHEFKIISADSSGSYDTSLNEICLFGYDLLGINKTFDAVRYLRFISGHFPDEAKPLVALADAYYKDGNMGLALRHYRLAFKVERTNVYAISMIRKITGSK